jgi:hypothetical protein
MDPRVHTTPLGLKQQFDLSMQVVGAWRKDSLALAEVRVALQRLDSLKKAAGPGARADSMATLDTAIAEVAGVGGSRLAGGGGASGARPRAARGPTLASLNAQLGGLYGLLQGTDAAPTIQATRAVGAAERSLIPLLARWALLRREATAL